MDKLRPATLLLAVLAGWAVALLVLALMGLGGRVLPAIDDPRLAPALPRFTLTKINSRLGAQSDYQEVADRPLMMPGRQPVAIAAAADTTTDFDAVLTSVLITPTLKLAILTDNQGGASHRVREGENVEGTSWRLQQLNPRQAIFNGPGGQRIMELRVYDGTGGAPATAVAELPQQPNANLDASPPGAAQPAKMATNPQAAMPTPMPRAVPPHPGQPPSPEEGQPQLTQEQQVDAIRKRIEARRAQARAEETQELSGQK